MVLMLKEIKEQPDVLEKCMQTTSEQIKEVVKEIKKSNINFIVIAARGTSDHAAVYAKYVFEISLGIPVVLAAPSVITVYEQALTLKNAFVLGISQSGKAEDVLEFIKAAKKQNALTCSITNDESSPLALEADYHLFTNAGMEKSVAATKTFTSQMMVIALLAQEWKSDTKLYNELLEVPTNMKNTIKVLDETVKEKVQKYKYIEDCFVLARGINYSIALETALKIQETTYVRAKGYATSDFYHGPFAMVEKDVPVIIYAPTGPSFKYMTEMINKLKGVEAELIIVTNDFDIKKLANTSFIIPPVENDIISPFYNIAVAQMFACQLALLKGLNPDKPRGLKKVTITR